MIKTHTHIAKDYNTMLIKSGITSKCSRCGATTYGYVDDTGFLKGIPSALCDKCYKEREEDYNNFVYRSNMYFCRSSSRYSLPERKEYRLTNKQITLIERLALFLEKKDIDMFYIYGNNGTGKTEMAILAAKEANINSTRFVFFPSFVEDMYYSNSLDIIRSLSKANTLIIDDLWNHSTTNHILNKIFLLLSNRINCNKKTILTSNFTPKSAIKKLMTSRNEESMRSIIDRVYGSSCFYKLSGESHRVKATRRRLAKKYKEKYKYEEKAR